MLYRLILLVGLAVITTGCTSTLEQLKRTTPIDSPFHAALSREYLEFAESEADQYDWSDSAYFAQKGLIAARGGKMEPEKLENWHLPPDSIAALQQGRDNLMTALDEQAMTAYPELSAKALFMFDCWVEQQEENWQFDHIDICREGFYDTLDKLLGNTTLYAEHREELKDAPSVAHKPILPAPVTLTYMVFFDSNSSKVKKHDLDMLKNIAKDVKALGQAEVVVNGHTDRAGSEQKNMTLSKKRADSVKSKLVATGISEALIKTFGFGETDPKIATKDGVANAANRRVEIIVMQEGK